MCQSNLLPKIHSPTDQVSCCLPEHWTSWLTKTQKNPILKGILNRCIEGGKSPWISRYGVKSSLWLWADNTLPLLNMGFICDTSRKVFQRCTAALISLRSSSGTGYSLHLNRCSREMSSDSCLQNSEVHAWQRIYRSMCAQCTPEL